MSESRRATCPRNAFTCSGSRVMCSALPILNVAAGGGPLEVGVELDAVGRIDVDALHLAAQPFALRQRRHHPQAVAEDHPVRPVGVVLVELRLGFLARQSVEIRKQVELLIWRPAIVLRLAHQVVNQPPSDAPFPG